MNKLDGDVPVRGNRMRIARSRGAASGFLLVLLGVWGALIPFVGPYFDFAWGTDQVWVWSAPRGWLEVLPGVATALGGLLLLGSRNRAAAMLGGWITVLAGAWFVTGRAFATVLNIGDVGRPLALTDRKFAALDLAYFSGLGALIVFLGALALGRLSVRSVRDAQVAERPVVAPEPAVEPAQTERIETSAFGPQVEPAAEGVPVAPTAEPERHRGFGWFRRHRETTTAPR